MNLGQDSEDGSGWEREKRMKSIDEKFYSFEILLRTTQQELKEETVLHSLLFFPVTSKALRSQDSEIDLPTY